jgi:hypothetical protein
MCALCLPVPHTVSDVLRICPFIHISGGRVNFFDQRTFTVKLACNGTTRDLFFSPIAVKFCFMQVLEVQQTGLPQFLRRGLHLYHVSFLNFSKSVVMCPKFKPGVMCPKFKPVVMCPKFKSVFMCPKFKPVVMCPKFK